MSEVKARRSLGAALAVLVAAAGLIVAAAPGRAGAIDIATDVSEVAPQTWVDGSQRQYVVTSGYQERDLLVARDTPSGAPDALWGTYRGVAGLRKLDVAAPAAGATRSNVVAAADGAITTVWSACSPECTRWFVSTQPDGTPIGDPTSRPAEGTVFRALDDGSFLATTAGGAVRWLAPDGAERAVTTIASTSLRAAAVDASGRLLLVDASGSLTRRSPGTAPDLTVATGCAGGDEVAVGPAADDGFAVACGATGVTLTRHEADGDVLWSATGSPDASPIAKPAAVAVDSTGRVWVAGSGTYHYPPPDEGFQVRATSIASYEQSEAPTARYRRQLDRQGSYDLADSRVTDLRAAAHRVAYADLQSCCTTIEGQVPGDHVWTGVLPSGSVDGDVPTCTPQVPQITAAGYESLTLAFAGCPSGSLGPVPTAYVVTAGSQTRTVPAAAPPATMTVTVDGLDPNALASASVRAANDAGTATTAATSATTVLPFPSADAFVARQYLDLLGRAPTAAERASGRAQALQPESSGQPGRTQLMASLLRTGRGATSVEPVTRLYRAYFLRDPDLAGLRFWVARRDAGRTLTSISESFAASSEFQRRYGKLTNRAFVAELYENVFGRPGDPTGVDFWTRRVDDRRLSRGGVVLQFSESSEGKRKAAAKVEAITAALLFYGRLPTALERSSWASLDPRYEGIARWVLGSEEYAERVAPD